MSDSSLALYRKYRPSTFKDVRDQDHIVTVLEGAIKKQQIPHALLFSGSRGTGKTTLARIFAREIGTKDIDLYEIDAASNRGIDDIRELKEAVHTLPYESKQKVYIIDEVHMLTKEAFNALLKTLEEPPAHVVFILATTEEEKLLDTIRSRCQVFRFHAPSRAVLAKTVTDVAKKEGFTLKPDAADLIAVSADGSFRDALGITQKVILASGDAIGSADEVATIIGAPRSALLEDIIDAFQTHDSKKGINAIKKAVSEQVEIKLFIKLILERVRAIILVRNVPDQEEQFLNAFNDGEAKRLKEYAEANSSPINSHLLLRLLDVSSQAYRSQIPELPLELAVIELCQKTEQ